LHGWHKIEGGERGEEEEKEEEKRNGLQYQTSGDVDTRIIPSCKKHCDFSNAVRKAIFGAQTTL
jgi:hypothetical protein